MIERTAWALVGFLCLSAEANSADRDAVGALVRQLGHPMFEKRIEAERQIYSLGPVCLPQVLLGVDDSDAEIARRCRRLVQHLRSAAAEQIQDDLLDHPWTADPALQKAWDRFHAFAGESTAARSLFAQMVRSETELMYGLSQPQPVWQELFERRCGEVSLFELRRRGESISTPSAAVLVFISLFPECRASSMSISCLSSVLMGSSFQRAIEDPRWGDVLRDLVGHWIARPDFASASQRMALAARYELSQGLSAAIELLDGAAGARSRSQRQYAILFIAKYGGREHIDSLEKLLKDETVLSTRNIRRGSVKSKLTVEVRDVALAALLHITKQDPEEYGFRHLVSQSQYIYAPNSPGFEVEDDRTEAMTRWHEWRRLNVRDTQPVPLDASEGSAL